MEQEPTVANGNVETVWSRMGGKTRDLRTRRSKLPIEQRLGPKVMTEKVDSKKKLKTGNGNVVVSRTFPT